MYKDIQQTLNYNCTEWARETVSLKPRVAYVFWLTLWTYWTNRAIPFTLTRNTTHKVCSSMFKWKLIRFTTLRKDCTFPQTIETHFQTSRNCCLVHVDTVDWLILLGYKLISKPCTLHVFTWLIDNIREQDLSGTVGVCHVLWFETVSRSLIWNCVTSFDLKLCHVLWFETVSVGLPLVMAIYTHIITYTYMFECTYGTNIDTAYIFQ